MHLPADRGDPADLQLQLAQLQSEEDADIREREDKDPGWWSTLSSSAVIFLLADVGGLAYIWL